MLYRCIECDQGFKRIEDLETHQQSSGHGVDHMINLRNEKAIYGDLNVYLDETVNHEAREPALVPSDHQVFMNLEKGPLPQHLFKRI